MITSFSQPRLPALDRCDLCMMPHHEGARNLMEYNPCYLFVEREQEGLFSRDKSKTYILCRYHQCQGAAYGIKVQERELLKNPDVRDFGCHSKRPSQGVSVKKPTCGTSVACVSLLACGSRSACAQHTCWLSSSRIEKKDLNHARQVYAYTTGACWF